MIRRPPRSTLDRSSAASDVYKRQARDRPRRASRARRAPPGARRASARPRGPGRPTSSVAAGRGQRTGQPADRHEHAHHGREHAAVPPEQRQAAEPDRRGLVRQRAEEKEPGEEEPQRDDAGRPGGHPPHYSEGGTIAPTKGAVHMPDPSPDPSQAAPIQRVLVVTAHPDDSEFGAGGTIAKLVREGKQVSYCIATNGNKGSGDRTMTPERLAVIRADEQRAAAQVLGVETVDFLGLPDCEVEDTYETRRAVTAAIRRHLSLI